VAGDYVQAVIHAEFREHGVVTIRKTCRPVRRMRTTGDELRLPNHSSNVLASGTRCIEGTSRAHEHRNR
jgi:hypothetical protein